MEYNRKETFKVNTPVRLETSYAVIDKSDDEEMEITVGVDDDSQYGYFEMYDTKTGGERFYAEGGLWFNGKELTDYDGVFELSQHVMSKLKEWGYDVSEME
jgi:hypothetical protein